LRSEGAEENRYRVGEGAGRSGCGEGKKPLEGPKYNNTYQRI